MKDFHVHSSFSADSEEPLELMILAGLNKHLTDLCFTEHIDFGHPNMTFLVDMPLYLEQLHDFQRKYSGQIRLHAGIELGIEPGNLADSLEFYQEYRDRIEFWIGSCHVFDGGDPYDCDFFSKMDAQTCYQDYFEAVLYSIRNFPQADTCGHLDYVMRFDPSPETYSVEKYSELLDSILKEVIRNECALELNTGSYRRGFCEPHPKWSLVRRYQALGGKLVTAGSDAHQSEDVASHFEEIYAGIRSLGLGVK